MPSPMASGSGSSCQHGSPWSDHWGCTLPPSPAFLALCPSIPHTCTAWQQPGLLTHSSGCYCRPWGHCWTCRSPRSHWWSWRHAQTRVILRELLLKHVVSLPVLTGLDIGLGLYPFVIQGYASGGCWGVSLSCPDPALYGNCRRRLSCQGGRCHNGWRGRLCSG